MGVVSRIERRGGMYRVRGYLGMAIWHRINKIKVAMTSKLKPVESDGYNWYGWGVGVGICHLVQYDMPQVWREHRRVFGILLQLGY